MIAPKKNKYLSIDAAWHLTLRTIKPLAFLCVYFSPTIISDEKLCTPNIRLNTRLLDVMVCSPPPQGHITPVLFTQNAHIKQFNTNLPQFREDNHRQSGILKKDHVDALNALNSRGQFRAKYMNFLANRSYSGGSLHGVSQSLS